MEYQVNELSTSFLEMRFKDERGAACVPTSGMYRIDDMTGLSDTVTGTEILGDTPFIPTESKEILEITSDENRILNEQNVWEDRQITVTFVYNTDKIGTDVFKYKVINLSRKGQ